MKFNFYKKTEAEKEFEKNRTKFMVTCYRDEKPLVRQMNSTNTLAFNAWAYLTRAEPPFDEIRVSVATEEELKEWYGDI